MPFSRATLLSLLLLSASLAVPVLRTERYAVVQLEGFKSTAYFSYNQSVQDAANGIEIDAPPKTQSKRRNGSKRDNNQSVSPDINTSQDVSPANFAAAAYCDVHVNQWSCGASCSATSDTQVLATGGDGGGTPFWFVAWSPSENRVIVSHEGTDPTQFESILDDAKFIQVEVDQNLAPATGGNTAYVHDGFQSTWESSRADVLSAVQSALGQHPGASVLVAGHSLGAAIASMDAVYLRNQLDSSVDVSAIVFGLPRVGNQAWANAVDAKLPGKFTHVVNFADIIPHLPPLAFGYVHPSGEVFVTSAGGSQAVNCPGQENNNCANSLSAFQYSIADHLGPYFGVVTGTGPTFCDANPYNPLL